MLSIIIVDDEEQLATLYREFCIKIGYNVTSFTNPYLAFKHFEENPKKYSLIVTDFRMPGLNGIDLANKIKETSSHVKIFLITAFDISDLEIQKYKHLKKIDKIIQKPVRYSVLKEMINQILIKK